MNKKVYILEYCNYDEHGNIGIYSSKKRAELALENIKPKRNRYNVEIVTHMVNNPKWYDKNE